MGSNVSRFFRDAKVEEDLRLGSKEIDMKWPYIALIVINMLLILPICIYMTYNYYLLRHSYIYNKRRPGLVIIFNSVAILFIGLYTPIHIIIMEIFWQNNATYDEWWDSFFFFTTQICVFVSFALRTWHSFYDFKLEYTISNTEWKAIINDKYNSRKQSFFLKHKKSLGKPRKTFLYFLIIPATIFSMIFVTIISLRVGYETEYLMLTISFIYLVLSVFLLIYIITQTWRDVFDNIYLRGEILWGCVVLCITVSLEAIIFCIDLIDYDVENEKYQQVFNWCFNFITSLSCFGLIIVSTQYVRIKVKKKEKELERKLIAQIQDTNKKQSNADDGGINAFAKGLMNDALPNDDENRWIFEDEVDFEALISTPDGLLEFLRFLAKEYELNYLVFAMEVTQYKSYVIPDLLRKHKQYVQELESSLIDFPSTMPQSSIIYNEDITQRKMFMSLYEKYIDQNADWPIKISTEIKNYSVSLYRRCQMNRARNPSMAPSTMRGQSLSSDMSSPIYSIRANPLVTELSQQSTMTKPKKHVALQDLKAMVEALESALNDVLERLKKSFNKYKESEAFGLWFAGLNAETREIMTQKYRIRKIVQDTVIQKEKMTDCKRWVCKHCTLVNRAITVDNKVRVPKSMCMCCGHRNNEIGVLVRHRTLMPNVFKHLNSAHSRLSTQLQLRQSELLVEIKPNMDRKSDINDTMRSVDFDTEFRDDELHDIIGPMETMHFEPEIEVILDENIVKEWEKMIHEIDTNKEDNTCEGQESDYIDSCPQIQKLHFVLRCYQYYLNKSVKMDEDKYHKNPNLQRVEYDIISMSELVNNLDGLNLQILLDIYQHVSTVHFEPDMFEHFDDTLGKCRGQCKPLTRNKERRGGNNMTNDDLNERNRRGRDVNIPIDEEVKEEKYTPFRPLRRVGTVTNNIDYLDGKGKRVTAEERITLSYLDKWHSFLFHPNVKQKQINFNITIEDAQNDTMDENERSDDEDEDEDEESEDCVIGNSDTVLSFDVEKKSNKFVTDASAYSSLSKVGTKMNLNLLNKDSIKGKSYDDEADDVNEQMHNDETFYEYGFGEQIEYHTLPSHFLCMKQELIGNDIHTITENVWDDTLAKALLCLEMSAVQENYRANDHGNANKYGVQRGSLIGVDNVIAILFYCNFDDLQNEFSKTFRRMEKYDTEDTIKERHCKNFYWLGRALYVAINFYGQRMKENQVVWHGLSSKMLFANFAAYFDCPTSTTTQKNVAQTFSGNGNGIILKLKSKHSNNCSWMLDVSLFSDFTDECERLFLNETLIITDILTIINKRWVSFRKYISACLFFNKITTGNANDPTWNISESDKTQKVLSDIIADFIVDGNGRRQTNSNIPHYVQILFRHYCFKQETPRLDNIDKIQNKMPKTLQIFMFLQTMRKNEECKDDIDGTEKVSKKCVEMLFPNATQYVNDQNKLISLVEAQTRNNSARDVARIESLSIKSKTSKP